MQIRVAVDDRIDNSHDLMTRIEGVVEGALERYGERVTCAEVHLSDLNSHKPGARDMRCRMAAWVAGGLKPVEVTHEAVTLTEALHAAAAKLERALVQSLGRAKSKAESAPAAEGEASAEGLGHLGRP